MFISAQPYILSLNHQATKSRNAHILSSHVLLALLDLDASILAHTAVQLDSTLVGLDAHLDARARRHESQHLQARILRSRIRGTICDECIVDSGAASSTVSDGVGDVLSDSGLWLGEVESGTFSKLDLAIWNENAVSSNATLCVGHVKGVVQDRHGIVVDEGAQVPVDVVGEHDRSGFVDRDGNEPRNPSRAFAVGSESVGSDVDEITREALLSSIVVGECDAGSRVCNHGPVALVVADQAAMKGVGAVVLVFGDLRNLAIDCEGTVLDSEIRRVSGIS